jgi:glycosyltransferase involved in cell wall biosynthesis
MSAAQKLPISVCMLVKNEEDRLTKSLPPLSIFEEVLVYDSGSTDESIEICKKYHAKVIQGEWLGFPETRKILFAQASQPWIFWLDADEVVTADLSKELLAINFESPNCEGFEVNRKVFFENKWINHGEWFPDWNIRIFRSDSWKMESQDVHEGIIIKRTLKRLNGLLEHHSYRDWEDRNSRIEKYAELWAQMKLHKGVITFMGEGTLRAIWRFFRNYIIKLGFLDGILGLKISISIAKEVNLKYKKLYQLDSH